MTPTNKHMKKCHVLILFAIFFLSFSDSPLSFPFFLSECKGGWKLNLKLTPWLRPCTISFTFHSSRLRSKVHNNVPWSTPVHSPVYDSLHLTVICSPLQHTSHSPFLYMVWIHGPLRSFQSKIQPTNWSNSVHGSYSTVHSHPWSTSVYSPV